MKTSAIRTEMEVLEDRTTPALITGGAALPAGGIGVSVAVGDFNNDAFPDLAVATGGNQIRLFQGGAGGAFTAAGSINLGATPAGIAVTDFDGDGHADDVATTIPGTDQVRIDIGDGAFGFTPSPVLGGTSPFSLPFTAFAVIPFDGGNDGESDLALLTQNAIRGIVGDHTNGAFITSGVGTTTGTNVAFAVADFGGGTIGTAPDGDEDAITVSTNPNVVNITSGAGGPTIVNSISGPLTQTVALPAAPTDVAVADFDGDGDPDVAVSTVDGVFLLVNDAGTLVAPAAILPNVAVGAIAAADTDGDGDSDLVVLIPASGAARHLTNDGTGAFTSDQTLDMGGNPRQLAVGNFNGDSRADVAVVGGDGLKILLGAPPRATLRGTVFNDTDNDGVSDLGEAGIAGLPVLLDADNDGTFETGTATDADGRYVFAGVAPGQVVVKFTPATGAVATRPITASPLLASGGDVTIDFGSFTAPTSNVPGTLVRSASGANASGIQAAVDAFRADLGTLNANQAGSFGTGRREINWDGVPAGFAAPNALPANFFNANSPRGVEFGFANGSTGAGFKVSGRVSDAGVGQPDVRFSTVNAAYAATFKTFSAERLFTAIGDNAYDVNFFVPGTSTPAKVRGFGAVFTDVDGTASKIELFGPAGQSLGVFTAPPADGGLSFLGVIDATGVGIAKVRVTTGNTPLGPVEGGTVDVVALDDFIYGEPVAINTPPAIGEIANQSVGATIPVTIFDSETAGANLQLTAAASDPVLFPPGSVVVGGSGANRTVSVTPAAGRFGTAAITLTVTDAGGLTDTETFDVTILGDLFAVGSGPGITGTVEVFNADASLRFVLHPYPGFSGGVTVGTGDVTGDGLDDIVTGAGPGGSPHVKVFDGATGAEIASFFAYSSSFRSGVFVGLGDVTGDGRADIVTGAGPGGGPHVKVLSGPTLSLVHSFFAFDPSFAGGVTVRAGDTDGDGRADIVTGAGPGGGPHVKVFSGTDLAVLQSFFAGDPSSTSGVFVGVANLFGDSRFDVVTGVNGRVSVWGNAANLLPYIEQENRTPLGAGKATNVAAVRQADGIIAILIGAAPGSGSSRTQIIDGTSNTIRRDFSAFGLDFAGGVFVG